MSENIKRQAIRGAGFQTIGGIIQIIIRLAGSMILARLLTPADFGIFALTTLVIGLLSQFTLLGAPQAIVAKRCISQTQLSSVFALNLMIGLFLTIIMMTSSSLVASFYSETALSSILEIMSIVIFIKAFGSVPNSLLTKEMKFHYINLIGIVSAIIETGIAIILVYYYEYNFWALVWGLVSAEIATTLLLIIAAQWKPTFNISSTAIGYYLKYGFHLAGENITTYVRQNIDYFIIGKLLGANALGIYSFAYRIPNLVNARLIGPASGVIIPYMSKLTNDEQTVQAYLAFTKLLAYVSFLLLSFLWVLANPIILLMWGDQWKDAVGLMQILIVVAAIGTVGIPMGSVFLKKSRPDLLFTISLIKLPITFIAVFLLGYLDGITGIAYGMALAALINLMISIYYLRQIIAVSLTQIIRSVFPPLFISIAVSLMGAIMINGLVQASYFLQILAVSPVIITLFYLALRLFFKNDHDQIISLLLNSRRNSNA